MSVLIKDMEMPKTCWDCACSNYYYHTDEAMCDITDETLDYILWKRERRSDCPLIEVPTPHGDLVDRDKLMTDVIDSDLDHLQRDDWKEVIQIVEDAHTIIEAEGSEE